MRTILSKSTKSNLFLCLFILTLVPNYLNANPIEKEEEKKDFDSSNNLNELLQSNNLQSYNLDKIINMDQDLTDEQRAQLKSLIPYLLQVYLQEQLNNRQYNRPVYEDLQDDDEYLEDGIEKRMSKKDDQRAKDLRRQQAARWDIGFGKRGSNNLKSKSFMDALYGKRSSLKLLNPKVSFGRKQQWDIQYGRK